MNILQEHEAANLLANTHRARLNPRFENTVVFRMPIASLPPGGIPNESTGINDKPMPTGPKFVQPAAKKILLADDDASVLDSLAQVLECEDYEVLRAKDGEEAVAKFSNSYPDMVLLDINMPEKDGWAAYRYIYDHHPLLPVIVITAHANQYAQARQLGVDALMEKPLNLPLLLEAVKILLSQTQAERVRRLMDPDFKTIHLNPPRHGSSMEAVGDGQK